MKRKKYKRVFDLRGIARELHVSLQIDYDVVYSTLKEIYDFVDDSTSPIEWFALLTGVFNDAVKAGDEQRFRFARFLLIHFFSITVGEGDLQKGVEMAYEIGLDRVTL